MDLLYRAYSSPMEIMRTYIRRGRFGDFVQGFLDAEYERKKAEAERDDEWHWWIAYVHSDSQKSFADWKAEILSKSEAKSKKKQRGSDNDLDESGINNIMSELFPSSTTKG